MEKGWQDWVQWVGSIILIPLIGVTTWTVFENKSNIAVMQATTSADHEMIREIRDDVKSLTSHIMTLEVVDK